MSDIIIFTLNSCLHCHELKKRLTDESIPFHDIEISKNRKIWDRVVSQTGHDVLPTIFIQIDSEGNGNVYTPGRDFQSNDEIIKIIKDNI